MASDGLRLIGLWFDGQKYFADILQRDCKQVDLSVFEQTKCWLDCYFKGGMPNFVPPLYLQGSAFRLSVWKILQQIPYGEVMTYGEIARELERKNDMRRVSAQAVGGAVGHNPISIIVPCHRVVGGNGSLTGYAGGIDKKQKLLAIEKVNMEHLFAP